MQEPHKCDKPRFRLSLKPLTVAVCFRKICGNIRYALNVHNHDSCFQPPYHVPCDSQEMVAYHLIMMSSVISLASFDSVRQSFVRKIF